MDNEYYYNNAKSRYYDACSEINSCNNRLNELNIERHQKVNQINDLNSQITKYQSASDQLDTLLQKETDLTDQCSAIITSVSDTAENFTAMVHSSDVCTKNLNDVYGTKNVVLVGNIFTEVRTRKTSVTGSLTTLKSDKTIAQNQLNDIDSSITSTNSSKSYWEGQKRNASIDMDYYKSKMDQEN